MARVFCTVDREWRWRNVLQEIERLGVPPWFAEMVPDASGLNLDALVHDMTDAEIEAGVQKQLDDGRPLQELRAGCRIMGVEIHEVAGEA